jgi:hypothetical protein
MLRRLSPVRTDVSEERIASIIRETRIGELEITSALISNRSKLRRNTVLYYTILYYTILYYTILYTVFIRRVLQLLVTANVVPSSPILAVLTMEAISFSESSVLTRATRRIT